MSTGRLKYSLSEFKSVVRGHIDLFILCASFERRCLSIAKEVVCNNLGVALAAHGSDSSLTMANLGELRSHFGERLHHVETCLDRPLETADNLRQALEKYLPTTGARIVVDITTFTHEQLLIILALLRETDRVGDLTLVYSGAGEYMIGEDKWLSRGIREIRSVLGFPGALLPSRDIHLLVLVGFELDRAQRLVDEYEPSVISLGYAQPADSIDEAMSVTNQEFHAMLAARIEGVQQFTFSCRDALATMEAILAQVARFPGQSAVVAPLNTKVSTVGAALAAMKVPEIQLCYAEARQYNEASYSRPGDSFYVVDTPPFWQR